MSTRGAASLARLGTIVWVALGVVLLAGSVRRLVASSGPNPAATARLAPVPKPAVPADTVHPSEADAYRPTYRSRTGTELVMVFIGASFCGADRRAGFPALVEQAKRTLRDRARTEGKTFSAHAVSVDWETERGLAFLGRFGAWDEISVGRNWVGEGARRFIWETVPGPATVPQLLVIERTLDDGDPVRVRDERALKRVVGADQISAWIEGGARL